MFYSITQDKQQTTVFTNRLAYLSDTALAFNRAAV